jgi:hypothetical protein
LVPSFLATENLQNRFFFQIFNFRFWAKFRQLKGKKGWSSSNNSQGVGFRFKFYSPLAKTTVYIFFGIKSARALAKLTRRSQVRNSNLFIIYLFICLFIFKNPAKLPFLHLNSVPIGGNRGPGKTQGAGRAAGRGWVRGGRPTKRLRESVEAAALG